MTDIINAGAYIRVSTKEQTLKGYSLEAQKEASEAYAKAHGFHIYDFYIDKGITARKQLNKRKDFMRMMDDVCAGRIKHIIVLRLDRFFRNVYDYHRMMNEYLTPHGCEWSAVMEEYDTTTPNGKLMINIRLSIAEQECDIDGARIKDIFQNKINNGYVITGEHARGYKTVDKRLVVDEEIRQEIVDMFDRYNTTGSYMDVCRFLRDTYGRDEIPSTIKRRLQNELYIGKYRENEDYCEPIIDKDVFYSVQDRIQTNVKDCPSKRAYYFASLIKCSVCGRTYASHATDRDNYLHINYVCRNKYYGRCDNTSIAEKYVESYLLENISTIADRYEADFAVKEREYKAKIKNAADIEKRLSRLQNLYVNGHIEWDKYNEEREKLSSQLAEEDAPKKKDLTELRNLLKGNFTDLYNSFSREEKRSFWHSIIKSITVDHGKIISVEFL